MKNIITLIASRKYMNLVKCISKELDLTEKEARQLNKKHKVEVNDALAEEKMIIRKGMKITITFESEKCDHRAIESDLDVVYEDQNILVVNKKSGEAVYSNDSDRITLANKVSYYFKNIGLESKIRFLNRLDYNTSGIVMIAKNSYAQAYLQKQIEARETKKVYIAFVEGEVKDENIYIDFPISKRCDEHYRYKVDNDGQSALTIIEKSEIKDDYTKLTIRIKTGRTHQIRVHMNEIGHKLLGDELYGGSQSLISRQALHAHIYGIKVPFVGYREFLAQLPSDLIKLC